MRLHKIIVASRYYKTPESTLRSYVGVAYLTNENQIKTGLLNPLDERIAVSIGSGRDSNREGASYVAAHHVFAGLYLERVAKVDVPRFEVFRLHYDVVGYGDEIPQIGDIVFQEDTPKGTLKLSLERFGEVGLADPQPFVEAVAQDRLGASFLPVPYQLAPEHGQYICGTELYPHPGLSFGEDSTLLHEYIEMFQRSRAVRPRPVM